jgi:hypothetical protein
MKMNKQRLTIYALNVTGDKNWSWERERPIYPQVYWEYLTKHGENKYSTISFLTVPAINEHQSE